MGFKWHGINICCFDNACKCMHYNITHALTMLFIVLRWCSSSSSIDCSCKNVWVWVLSLISPYDDIYFSNDTFIGIIDVLLIQCIRFILVQLLYGVCILVWNSCNFIYCVHKIVALKNIYHDDVSRVHRIILVMVETFKYK